MTVGLVVEIIGDASKLAGSLDGAQKKVGGFGAGISGSTLAMAGLAGAAVVAVGAIADMTKAASEDAAEAARLEAAVKAAGAAHGDYATQIDAAIAAGQAKAFSDTQSREALMSLVTATGDVNTATTLLTQAQDIARFANVDLATAADAVAKAQAGQDGPLAKLLPGLQKGATATDTLAAATAAAAGQADEFASSTEGQMAIAGDAFGELGETVGSVFLPIISEIVPILIPILQKFGELVKQVLPILIPLIKLAAQYFGIMFGILGKILDVIIKLVTWFADLVDGIADFLGKLGPLKAAGDIIGGIGGIIGGKSAAGSSGAPMVGTRAAGSSSASSITINVNTTGDGIEAEQAVVRALRRVTRINGGVIPAAGMRAGWVGG